MKSYGCSLNLNHDPFVSRANVAFGVRTWFFFTFSDIAQVAEACTRVPTSFSDRLYSRKYCHRSTFGLYPALYLSVCSLNFMQYFNAEGCIVGLIFTKWYELQFQS